MPGNLCTPDYLAGVAREIAARHQMQVTVLGRAELEQEKMGSFLCVAQGTPQDPKLITLEYMHGPAGSKPIALVGKGLCFDSGGISIKPAQGMEAMKFDMCGAAGVLGAMESIGRLALPVNVVGLVGSTTNMPSGTAVNPGDVVRSHLGKTIEVINTDAEGRLVLADVLSYARRFSPSAVVDAATLTGACVIALGHTASGVFGTDDALVADVLAAGTRAGEPGWRLPLYDEYKDLIKSDVADIKNTGGRPAGACTAAMFLKEFAEDFAWVHLDIAGTAYSESDLTYVPKGPTGVPVGTFVELVRGRARSRSEGPRLRRPFRLRATPRARITRAGTRRARTQPVPRPTRPSMPCSCRPIRRTPTRPATRRRSRRTRSRRRSRTPSSHSWSGSARSITGIAIRCSRRARSISSTCSG